MGVAESQQNFIYKNTQLPDLVHRVWFANRHSIPSLVHEALGNQCGVRWDGMGWDTGVSLFLFPAADFRGLGLVGAEAGDPWDGLRGLLPSFSNTDL